MAERHGIHDNSQAADQQIKHSRVRLEVEVADELEKPDAGSEDMPSTVGYSAIVALLK